MRTTNTILMLLKTVISISPFSARCRRHSKVVDAFSRSARSPGSSLRLPRRSGRSLALRLQHSRRCCFSPRMLLFHLFDAYYGINDIWFLSVNINERRAAREWIGNNVNCVENGMETLKYCT